MLTDALYASVALYGLNKASEAYNGFIELARWTAPLVTASAIICVIEHFWNNIIWRVKCISKDCVAVYSDEAIEIKVDKGTKVIYPGESFKKFARSHILLFSSDQKNLEFYEKNKNKLQNTSIYIGLKELETGLIKKIDNAIVFDINGAISRSLWKEIKLWKKNKPNPDILIYGNDLLAQNILRYGLLINLFSKNQNVTYHLAADNSLFIEKYPNLEMQNGDEIVYHNTSDENIWELVRSADYVIVADIVSAELIQTFAVNSCAGELYYYSPRGGNAGDYIALKNMKAFGRDKNVLTDENIRRRKLIQTAIELNAQYVRAYGSKEEKNNKPEDNWIKLSGFLKNSNISSADFNEVLAELPESLTDEELAELEHIRWCRFLYLNYWQKGIPSNGKNKDEEKRIHKNLKPYCELSKEEKDKDLAVVRTARIRRSKK